MRKCPFCVAGQFVVPCFVGSVREASSCVFFSDGVPSGISSSGVYRLKIVLIHFTERICRLYHHHHYHHHCLTS